MRHDQRLTGTLTLHFPGSSGSEFTNTLLSTALLNTMTTKNENQQYYHQLPDLKLDHCFSTHHSTSTATSQPQTYTHTHTGMHVGFSIAISGEPFTSVHAHIYTGFSPRVAYIIFKVQNKQKCKALVQLLWKTERWQNRVLSTCRSWAHIAHSRSWPCLSPPTTQSWPHCSAYFFTLEQRKADHCSPYIIWNEFIKPFWTYQCLQEEGNRPTDIHCDDSVAEELAWPLASWNQGSWGFHFSHRRPTRVTWACVSEHSRAAGSTGSLASPLGHILCKKSP